MSDKDDLFTPDEEFGDLGSDDFFSDGPETAVEVESAAEAVEEKPEKKVKVPSSILEAEPEVEEPEVEESEVEEVEEPEVEEPKEVEEVEPEVVPEPKKEKKAAPKKAASESLKKKASKPLTLEQKEINKILRAANIDETGIIDIDELTRDRRRTAKMKISDIAVFIKKPENELLAKLFEKIPSVNTVNLSAEVDPKRVKDVAAGILSAGRMYQPIQVAEIEEDGSMQCTSGRHRLIGLAILYGPDAEVMVQVEKMSLATARDAVVVANMARKAKAMEQAEHAALSAVSGDVDADQDELFGNMARTKTGSKKYCVYTVLERGKPVTLEFKVGEKKNEDIVMTISTIEGFWGAATNHYKGITRKEFDPELKASTQFINKLVKLLQANLSFDKKCHAASKFINAIGRYYRTMLDAGTVMDDAYIKKLSEVIVALPKESLDSNSIEAFYQVIVKAMK